ncbi:hypothetical protein [Bacillus sp. FJAT-27225]|uniref:hypothetical protein n=1 Tax=Bacillus sp. FJAT-27225 TaxID=1743144 RepID=UPI002685C160
MEAIEMIGITEDNVDTQGCFCLRSKPNSIGYKNKKSWLLDRVGEGLKYIKLIENGKPAGFIEYTPIEIRHESYLVKIIWLSIACGLA